MVIWITGLPGAGKTTIATLLLEQLRNKKVQTVLLDGDQLRKALDQHRFDVESRHELAFTYARISKMHSEQESVAICATVAMFDEIRDWNRKNIKNYFEVYIKVELDVLKARNKKKLYSRSKTGSINNVYGYDIKIEEPKHPDMIINNNDGTSLEQHVCDIMNALTENKYKPLNSQVIEK